MSSLSSKSAPTDIVVKTSTGDDNRLPDTEEFTVDLSPANFNTVCLNAYRQTGKDTLFAQLSTNRVKFTSFPDNEAYKLADAKHPHESIWRVYVCPSQSRGLSCISTLRTLCSKQRPANSTHRLAYADVLKEDVHNRLHLPPPLDMDAAAKDKLVVYGKLLREHYKERAAEVRSVDSDFYAAEVFRRRRNILQQQPGSVIIITDLRYPNELSNVEETMTVRLFRRQVPLPSEEDTSERSLDTLATDVLLIPHDWEEAQTVCELFPQYEHYSWKGMLTCPPFV